MKQQQIVMGIVTRPELYRMVKQMNLALVTLLLVLVGCEKEGETYEYSIENKSGQDIVFKLYTQMKRTDNSIQNVYYIHLPKGEKLYKEYYSTYYDFRSLFQDYYQAPQNELPFNTIEVIYGNKKKKILVEQYESEKGGCRNIFEEKVPCDDRNPLNRTRYQNKKEHFIFTPEDYQQAEDW